MAVHRSPALTYYWESVYSTVRPATPQSPNPFLDFSRRLKDKLNSGIDGFAGSVTGFMVRAAVVIPFKNIRRRVGPQRAGDVELRARRSRGPEALAVTRWLRLIRGLVRRPAGGSVAGEQFHAECEARALTLHALAAISL
jgi:hypothetical protein